LSSLRWVHTASAGVNHLLCPALSEAKGVALTNARGIYSGSLAEWALFACAYFAKDLPRLLAAQATATWAPYDVEELRGRTLGVVGFGDIGQATARLAQAYGMRVIATRRRAAPPEPGAPCDEFYALDRLPALMGASDYVVMATPLTPETTKLVSREAIAAMKPTGVFINIGRGPCVDEAALTECVRLLCMRPCFAPGGSHC
jgi:phosphoglycerate dehydrogenase-like enzyme